MELDETIATFHQVLSFVGISIFSKENCFSKPWLILQIFNFIIAILCFIFTTAFVVANCSNLPLFIQGACIWTTGVIMTISLGVCLFFRLDFRNYLDEMVFVDRMLEMPLVEYVTKLENRELSMLTKLKNMVEDSHQDLLKYTRIALKCYVASVWLTATLYLCSPIVVMILNGDGSQRLLAFDMLFPWSLQNLNVYIASFIFHAYCGYLCCIAYPGLQCTIILLIGQLIRQIRILTFILLNLNELAVEVSGKNQYRWQITHVAILSQCIDHYSMLKRFSNKLNYICRPFYLALILVAIMLVCMCSVKISVSDKLSLDTMKYYIHEFCFILVVLMFCLLGQQVENEYRSSVCVDQYNSILNGGDSRSGSFLRQRLSIVIQRGNAASVLESFAPGTCASLEIAVTEKWYIFDNKHKKNVLLFNMAVSQRMPIYIFGTITLSLPTFSWFIRTGMSFFTLVMTALEEEQ